MNQNNIYITKGGNSFPPFVKNLMERLCHSYILAKPTIIAGIAGIFLFMLDGEISVSAADKDIDIHTKMNPNGYIFEVGNLKPGDSMPFKEYGISIYSLLELRKLNIS
ncbi:hypothetical protein ACTHQT_17060 [Cytobacillus praedii]